jgi:hypothetical protein
VQQHGRSGKVLGRLPKKWRCIGVGVGVRVSIGASIVVGLWRAHQWRRCTDVRLVHSQTALASVAILVTGLTLHGNVLRRASIVIPLSGMALHGHALRKLSVAGLGIHVELLV